MSSLIVTKTASNADAVSTELERISTTTVYFIRHGRSVSNEWMEGSPENHFGAPTYNDYNGNVRDSPLSAAGIEQAKILCRTLQQSRDASWLHRDVQLIAVSPLTRCLETFVYGVAPAAAMDLPVHIAPLLRERVYTLSETGRPYADLRKDFRPKSSEWDWSACDDTEGEEWWYTTPAQEIPGGIEAEEEWRPLPAVYAVPGEPQAVFDQRMNELRKWLCDRPEYCILAVAHWGVIQHFAPQDHVENCQVVRVELKHDE